MSTSQSEGLELRDGTIARLEEDFADLWRALQAAVTLGAADRIGHSAKSLAAYLAARDRLAISALEDLEHGRIPVLAGIREEGLRAMAPFATVELPAEAVLRWLRSVHEALMERLRGSSAELWQDGIVPDGRTLPQLLGADEGGPTLYAAVAAEVRAIVSRSTAD